MFTEAYKMDVIGLSQDCTFTMWLSAIADPVIEMFFHSPACLWALEGLLYCKQLV